MADDIAALIDHLGLETPDVVGYSLGGGVAFMTATRHPDTVGRLVTACVYLRPDVSDPALRAQQGQVSAAAAEFMKDTPMYQVYQAVAPRPEDFGRLLDKIGESMKDGYDYTEDFRSLRVPTLLVASDADQAPPSHYVEMFKLLDGGLRDGGWMGENRPKGGHALAILPGLTTTTPSRRRSSPPSRSTSSTGSRAERRWLALTCDRLGTISAPTLALGGEHGMAYSRRILETLAQCIPGSRLVVLPRVTHFMSYQASAHFNRVVLDFLARPWLPAHRTSLQATRSIDR